MVFLVAAAYRAAHALHHAILVDDGMFQRAEDMQGAVDSIAAVTVNSKFDINDYALALAQGGAAAQIAGLSMEEFNTQTFFHLAQKKVRFFIEAPDWVWYDSHN